MSLKLTKSKLRQIIVEEYQKLIDNPIVVLKKRLNELHLMYKAENYDALTELVENPHEIRRLAIMIGDVDEYLTDKRRPSDYRYEKDALELMELGRPVVHLSDGGYSRLTLAYDTPKLFWIDRGLFTPKVVKRWDQIMGN